MLTFRASRAVFRNTCLLMRFQRKLCKDTWAAVFTLREFISRRRQVGKQSISEVQIAYKFNSSPENALWLKKSSEVCWVLIAGISQQEQRAESDPLSAPRGPAPGPEEALSSFPIHSPNLLDRAVARALYDALDGRSKTCPILNFQNVLKFELSCCIRSAPPPPPPTPHPHIVMGGFTADPFSDPHSTLAPWDAGYLRNISAGHWVFALCHLHILVSIAVFSNVPSRRQKRFEQSPWDPTTCNLIWFHLVELARTFCKPKNKRCCVRVSFQSVLSLFRSQDGRDLPITGGLPSPAQTAPATLSLGCRCWPSFKTAS